MITDERTEFDAKRTITDNAVGSDELDTQQSLEQTGPDIDLAIVVHSLAGTVTATLQESDDKATWRDLFAFGSLPVGHTSVRLPPFSQRYLRVFWTVTGGANVSASLTLASARNA